MGDDKWPDRYGDYRPFNVGQPNNSASTTPGSQKPYHSNMSGSASAVALGSSDREFRMARENLSVRPYPDGRRSGTGSNSGPSTPNLSGSNAITPVFPKGDHRRESTGSGPFNHSFRNSWWERKPDSDFEDLADVSASAEYNLNAGSNSVGASASGSSNGGGPRDGLNRRSFPLSANSYRPPSPTHGRQDMPREASPPFERQYEMRQRAANNSSAYPEQSMELSSKASSAHSSPAPTSQEWASYHNSSENWAPRNREAPSAFVQPPGREKIRDYRGNWDGQQARWTSVGNWNDDNPNNDKFNSPASSSTRPQNQNRYSTYQSPLPPQSRNQHASTTRTNYASGQNSIHSGAYTRPVPPPISKSPDPHSREILPDINNMSTAYHSSNQLSSHNRNINPIPPNDSPMTDIKSDRRKTQTYRALNENNYIPSPLTNRSKFQVSPRFADSNQLSHIGPSDFRTGAGSQTVTPFRSPSPPLRRQNTRRSGSRSLSPRRMQSQERLTMLSFNSKSTFSASNSKTDYKNREISGFPQSSRYRENLHSSQPSYKQRPLQQNTPSRSAAVNFTSTTHSLLSNIRQHDTHARSMELDEPAYPPVKRAAYVFADGRTREDRLQNPQQPNSIGVTMKVPPTGPRIKASAPFKRAYATAPNRQSFFDQTYGQSRGGKRTASGSTISPDEYVFNRKQTMPFVVDSQKLNTNDSQDKNQSEKATLDTRHTKTDTSHLLDSKHYLFLLHAESPSDIAQEADNIVDRDRALRYAVRHFQLSQGTPKSWPQNDEKIRDALPLSNLKYSQTADARIAKTTVRIREIVMNRIIGSKSARSRLLKVLQDQYSCLNVEWSKHCQKLEAEEHNPPVKAQDPESIVVEVGSVHNIHSDISMQTSDALSTSQNIAGGRSSRRYNGGGVNGDAARSEAEFLEILATLEVQERSAPSLGGMIQNAAKVPDMLAAYKSVASLGSKLILDPLQYFDEGADLDAWTEEEKDIYCESFPQYPKQFDTLASFLPDKRVSDLVQFYYLTKKHYNFKANLQKLKRRKAQRAKPFLNSNKSNLSMRHGRELTEDSVDDETDDLKSPCANVLTLDLNSDVEITGQEIAIA